MYVCVFFLLNFLEGKSSSWFFKWKIFQQPSAKNFFRAVKIYIPRATSAQEDSARGRSQMAINEKA